MIILKIIVIYLLLAVGVVNSIDGFINSDVVTFVFGVICTINALLIYIKLEV